MRVSFRALLVAVAVVLAVPVAAMAQTQPKAGDACAQGQVNQFSTDAQGQTLVCAANPDGSYKWQVSSQGTTTTAAGATTTVAATPTTAALATTSTTASLTGTTVAGTGLPRTGPGDAVRPLMLALTLILVGLGCVLYAPADGRS